MKVLVGCEYSGKVRDAFIKRGHEAVSCDLLPTDVPGPHYQGDLKDIINDGWDLAIFHPPCTYLTNSGVRFLHEKSCPPLERRNPAILYGRARRVAMGEARTFFNELLKAPIPRICAENPIPHKYARAAIGKYTQIIQPWQFGHPETKATCLWLRDLPNLTPTEIVEGRNHSIHMASPGPDRWKIRSETFQGIADAMAEQWGSLDVS